ncbi:hypothetical protein V1638_04335 [Pseudarthrobacter sp. J64]|uniref:hypothetical protein n=1 Tax=Pseudarthrobacter sp. J64 TaxID=3116485 RepID=UPI002E806F18|nr:hypothetical protein [Pseudarthrobacter sp. J64]MEE2568624.1 hypothetical protein [Pseudarthrobacter sp. J64]
MPDLLTPSLTFPDPRDLADLRTFATRAKSIDDGAMRLQASGSVLAAYVCVLRPRILGENTPTILGLRTMGLARESATDVTVPIGAVLDRLARAGENDVDLPVPPSTVTESWTGVSAPRSGWSLVGSIPDAELSAAAEAGITEVAALVPASPGAHVVNSARAAVWGRDLPAGSKARPAFEGLPAGAAFAALTLGFLGDGEQRVYRAGRWFRLSGVRGHVLVRTGAGL